MLRLRWLSWLVVLAGAISWAGARFAESQAVRPERGGFFAGRTITYIVCSGPGGGYDTYARLIARHLERHLDGVRVVVRNVPGAAHLVGLDVLNAAPPDGLTIGTFTAGTLFLHLAGTTPGFDPGRLSWIGKAAAEPRVLVVGARTPYRTLEDLRRARAPISIATEGAKSPAHLASGMVSRALGLNARLIPGFTEDEGQLAVLRGDVTALLASPTSLRALLEEGHAFSVLRIGGTITFNDDVPTLDDLTLAPADRAFLELVATQGELGRVTAGPPGVPADRLAELRRAYAAAVADPALLAEAARLRLPIDAIDGARLESRVRQVLNPPPHVREWLRGPRAR